MTAFFFAKIDVIYFFASQNWNWCFNGYELFLKFKFMTSGTDIYTILKRVYRGEGEVYEEKKKRNELILK